MTPSPIIFLDIDGVLAMRPMGVMARAMPPRSFGAKPVRLTTAPARAKPPRRLSAAAIGHLNKLVRESGALVVVSSSWRHRDDTREVLSQAGVAGPFHDDWRTDADGPSRGDEITRWLNEHDQPAYVVLDDWAAGLDEHLNRLVHTDHRVGLQAQHVYRASCILSMASA